MTFETQWVDVTPFLLQQVQPVALLRREQAHDGPKAWAGQSQVGTVGDYWVFQGNVVDGDQLSVSPVRGGEGVRIPMWAYRTTHRAMPAILGLGVQIGLAALERLREHTPVLPRAAYLVIGHECTDLMPAAEAFRCYIGIALRTK